MTSEQSWAITPRAYSAYVELYDGSVRRWAFERAEFRNANFNLDPNAEASPDLVPWTAADFLGTGDREQRMAEAERNRMEAKVEEFRSSLPTAEVPEWAIKARDLHQAKMKVANGD